MAGTTLKLTASETVTVVSDTPEGLVVEATYGPGGSTPPPHFHPAQDEHFEVLEGEITAKVGGAQRKLGPGATLDVPRKTVHQMWNAGDAPARVRWTTAPAGRTREWFEAIDALNEQAGGAERPPLLAFATVLPRFKDTFILAVGARPVVYGLLSLLSPLGRRKGFGPKT